MFTEDEQNNELNTDNFIPIKDDLRFKKYFRMLSFKIPVQSVKEKMSNEGIDPNIIDQDPNKPYIEKKIECNAPQIKVENKITANDLLSGISLLKKKKPVDKKKIIKDKLKDSSRFEPPSLDDILKQLKKIKNKNL